LLYGSVPRYMRRSHHPREEASTQMAMDYIARSPAAQAAPRD
jgi:predicted metal-dependent hydrolase